MPAVAGEASVDGRRRTHPAPASSSSTESGPQRRPGDAQRDFALWRGHHLVPLLFEPGPSTSRLAACRPKTLRTLAPAGARTLQPLIRCHRGSA